MNYKYSLDKTSKKFRCPSCQKKGLVRYIENENGNYCNSNVGRCDRQQKCGYHFKPEFNKVVETYKPTKNLIKTVSPIHLLPTSIILPTLGLHHFNNLVDFLFNEFNESKTKEILIDYKVGTSKKWKGATLFWQIDLNNKVRSGKIIDFDSISGKRKKYPFPRVTWVHTILEKQNKLPKNYKLEQCLFGEHLLTHPSYSNKTVAIVESEKTALIMAINYPNYLWLSCGSINGIKTTLLKPIKNKRVVLFPDKGCFEKWQEQTVLLNNLGYNLKVSPLLEGLNIDKGLDLADLFDNSTGENPSKDNSNKGVALKCNNSVAQQKIIYDTNGNPVTLTPELDYLITKLDLENE